MSNLSKQGKLAKAFTAMTSVATVLSLSGVAYLAPVAALAVAPADYGLKEGDVVSAAGSDDPDVYIVNEHGFKRLFLNPAIFNFYGHLGGFSAVKNVSPATRDAFGTSGLFRNCETNDPKVYGVETTGEDVGMLHWVNTSGTQAVMDDANFFKKVFCINNNEFSWYPKGSDYTSVNQVPNYSRGSTPVVTGPISVSLASSNPAAGSIVDTQSRYHLASFMFSGSGSVTKLKMKRIGISADASLTSVYLYDGNKRLTDSATVSDSHITFNDTAGLFTAGKVISVMADVDGTSGETLGVQVVEVNGTAVPAVSGNLHTIATATLATLSVNSTTTPSDGDNDGDDDDNTDTDPANDVLAWQNVMTVGQRYVWLKSVQYRVIGSVLPSDLQNFRLYVDGVMVGSAVAQADSAGYILFDLSGAPVKMETGNRTLKVLVNIVGGSNKEFYLSLRQKSDIWVVDSQYGAAVASSGTFPVGDVDNDLEIAQGTLTVTKMTNSPSGDVVKDASGVVLGRYEFKAAGERLKVENLRVAFTSTDNAAWTEIRNGALFADGVQIGSTADIEEDSESTPYTEFNLGSSLIITPGTPVTVEVRGDIFDGDGTNTVVADDTFNVEISTGSSNVQRLTSLNYFNGPSSDQVGNSLDVKTGSLTASKYTGYANQSIVVPKNGVKLGHFTLTAASAEDININTVTLDSDTPVGTSFAAGDITDLYIKVWNDAGSAIYTSPVKSTISATASNSYSVNFAIPKNKTFQVEAWGNVGSTVTAADAFNFELDASGTTTGSSTTASSSAVDGQVMTAQNGALTFANGSLPVAQFVNGGVTKNVYNFTITPTYDDFFVDEIYVDIASTSNSLLASQSGAVSSVMLKDGSTTLATANLNATTGSASFTGLNLSLPQSGGTKTLSVDVMFANVGVGANDTGGQVKLRLDGYKRRNSAGSITTTTGLAGLTYTSNAFVDVKGYPTFTNVALPSTLLVPGTLTLFKTSANATGGQIAWSEVTFTVASNSTATIGTFRLFENGVDITDSATASNSAGTASQRVTFAFTTERVVSAGSSVTLELRATVGGTVTAGDTISTSLSRGLGTTVTTEDRDTQNVKNSAFIWTDQSAPSHSTTTDDWFTDGLLKSLDEQQALTK